MAKKVTEDGEILDTNCEDCVIGHVPPFFRTPFNYNTHDASLAAATTCNDPSLTDQSFKEEVDINNIMERVKQGAQLPVPLPEHFGDAFDVPTLLEARMKIAENNATFWNLPARIREEFMNDPSRWEVQVQKDIEAGDLDHLEEMGIDTSKIRTALEAMQDYDKAEAAKMPKTTPEGGSPAPKGAPAGPGGAPAPSGTETDRPKT